MKKILLLFGGIIPSFAFAQLSSFADTNNIKANVMHSGDLFGTFEVPKGSGTNTIYASNIWIGALDAGANLHVSAQTYGQGGRDFNYGPIGTVMSGPTYDNAYKKVWRVSKATIQYHIANYTNTNYIVPPSIANWPGNGNITNGESPKLAPYFDANNNNTYDPVNGDYPIIRGDLAVFFMMNDSSTAHTETGGVRLGFEVHGMVYEFASTSDSALWNTVFVNYEIFNRSSLAYNNVFVGVWTDMDLGDYSDDFVGCDSTLQLYYTYNGDAQDGNGGPGSYGVYPPAQGIIYLSEPLKSFTYYNNDFSVTGNPAAPDDYFTYLLGKWKDSTFLTYGGNGYGGTTNSTYMYSGSPETSTGWTEISVSNSPGDRRALGTMGGFTLAPDQKYCADIAFPFALDYSVQNNNLNSITLLKQRTQAITSFYALQQFNCDLSSGYNETEKENFGIYLFPNPSSGDFHIESFGINDRCLVSIYAMNGQLIKSIQTSNGVNEKISIDAEEGIYFVVVNAGDKVITKKLVVIN
jgi:hypothetical protein